MVDLFCPTCQGGTDFGGFMSLSHRLFEEDGSMSESMMEVVKGDFVKLFEVTLKEFIDKKKKKDSNWPQNNDNRFEYQEDNYFRFKCLVFIRSKKDEEKNG